MHTRHAGEDPRSGRPAASAASNQTGTRTDRHGAAVPVTQWVAGPSAGSSETHDPVVCEPRTGPNPACMHTVAPISPPTG